MERETLHKRLCRRIGRQAGQKAERVAARVFLTEFRCQNQQVLAEDLLAGPAHSALDGLVGV
jgi:hypothetical protein